MERRHVDMDDDNNETLMAHYSTLEQICGDFFVLKFRPLYNKTLKTN